MPRKTDGEKIDELEKLVATVLERVDNIRSELEGLAEIKQKVAILDERLTELKRTGEEAARKRWALVPVLVAAVVGALLTLLAQLLLAYLRGDSP